MSDFKGGPKFTHRRSVRNIGMNLMKGYPTHEKDVHALKYYINVLLIYLKYFRIWREDDVSSNFVLLIVTGIIAILLTGTFLLITAEMTSAVYDFNVQRFVNIISSMCLHVSAFVKWIFCLTRSNDIAILLGKLNKCHLLCIRIADNEEAELMHFEKVMRQARSYSTTFLFTWNFVCIYGVIHWCLNPLLVKLFLRYGEHETLNMSTVTMNMVPFIGWYPWDITHSSVYICTYLLQVIGAMGTAFGAMSLDILYVTVLLVIFAEFQYLNLSLRNEVDNSARAQAKELDLDVKLRSCVVFHSEVTKLIAELEVLVSPVMFVLCIKTLIVICLLSLEASTIVITLDIECMMKIWSMVEYFLAAATQLYIFCFCATQIRFQSLMVADSVYLCGWENAMCTENKKGESGRIKLRNIKHLVQRIIVRARKPIILTGGPFYELSLETFKAIIGMAISNSIILRQVSEMD